MVKVEILKNATILAPNRLHQNFTATENYLQKGKELKGEYITINGRRRGSEFDYRLFRTEKGNLIYAKNVKPINTETMTEVNLGVDGRPTPTKIKMPNDKKYDNAHIYAAVLGTLGGFALAKKLSTLDIIFEILSTGFLPEAARNLSGFLRFRSSKKILFNS